MRDIQVTVTCNGCGKRIDGLENPDDAEVNLSFTPPGEDTVEAKFDLCPECLDNWRADVIHVTTVQPPDDPSLTCFCGFVGKNQRGLSRHKSARSHY